MEHDVEQVAGGSGAAPAPARDQVTSERLILMRRVAVLMFLVGGAVCVVGVIVTQRTAGSRRSQSMCVAAIIVSGLLLLAMRRPRQRVIEATVVVSLVILAALMATSNPIGSTPLFYLWPMVFSAYFFTRRVLLLMSGCMLVSLAAGLGISDHAELKFDTFLGTASSVGIMAALVCVMTEREARLRAALEEIASTDPLTGLLNRRAFDPCLRAMAARAAAAGSSLTVVMLDLDHFKRFNDRHGHLLGDRALEHTGRVLREQSREGDAVSRFGGEEFAVALADCDRTEALAYAGRVAVALSTCLEDDRLALSASAGICELQHGTDGSALLSRADAALYAAKQAGRGRAAWWDGARYVDEAFDLRPPSLRPTLPAVDSWR